MLDPKRRLSYGAAALIVLASWSNSWAQWSTGTLSLARRASASAAAGDKLLIGGGRNAAGVSNVVDIYTNSANAWTTATLSEARTDLAAAAVGNKILFAGGMGASTNSAVVDIYDVVTGAWTTAVLSQARHDLVAATVGTKVIFAGGAPGNGQAVVSAVVDIYDDSNGSWTTATLSQARMVNGAATIGTKVYFPGGQAASDAPTSVVDVYDNANNSWGTITAMPTTRFGAGVAAVNDKLVIYGGNSPDHFDIAEIYQPSTEAWTTKHTGIFSSYAVGVTVGTKIYFVGLYNQFTPKTVLVFDGNDTWGISELSVGRMDVAAAAVGTKLVIGGGDGGSHSAVVDIYTTSCTPPGVGFTPSSMSICPGQTATITLSGSNSYKFLPADGLTPAANSFTVNPAVSTKYFVTGTSNGCFRMASYQVNISTFSCPEITGYSASKGHEGATITVRGRNFDVSQSQSPGIIKFNGVNATVLGASAYQFDAIVPLGATTGPITYAMSGLSATGPTFQVACEGPPLSTTGNVEMCDGTPTTISASGAQTYQWTTPDGTTSAGSDLVVTSVNLQIGQSNIWTVVGTHNNGCVSLATLNINTIDCPPEITSFSPPGGPPGTSVIIHGTRFSPCIGCDVVAFNGVEATNITSASVTTITAKVPAGASSGPITVSNGGLTGTSLTNFVVCATPTLTVSGNTSICAGGTVTLVASGATTYTWSPAEGLSAVTGSTVTATASTAITYTVTGTIAGGCSASTTVPIVVTGSCATISSFAPAAGAVGSPVFIYGNFPFGLPDYVVKFNGVTALVSGASSLPGLIVVEVPEGATAGRITITAAGKTVTTATDFTVTVPVITSFSPASGSMGTLVTINGSGFNTTADDNIVMFGDGKAAVSSATATKIEALLGAWVTSGPITVTSHGKTGTSATNFTVPVHPDLQITSFSPAGGTAGTVVTINGSGFVPDLAENVVRFGGVTASVTAATATSITAIVPATAATGYITVVPGGRGKVTSATNFTVSSSSGPQITSFTGGPKGSAIEIYGSGFSTQQGGNVVKFNGVTATLVYWAANILEVQVPTAATTGPITVTANGSTATSATNFTVTGTGAGGPQITSFSPGAGVFGASVTITGSGFSTQLDGNTVKFFGVLATVINWSATSLTVHVPASTTTGPIIVYANGLVAVSATNFTVTSTSGMQITSFSPTSGPVGNRITITGTGFNQFASNNIVKFNGVTAQVSDASTTAIVAYVPEGATTGPITVTTNGTTATSSANFTMCLGCPGDVVITTFSPASAPIGSNVTITGSGFGIKAEEAQVKFNGTPALIASLTPTTIVATVPTHPTLPGAINGRITVKVFATATSATNFTASGVPGISMEIMSFSPAIGISAGGGFSGTLVTINGVGFDPILALNAVKFNGVTASLVSSSATTLVAHVPLGATTGPITYHQNGFTVASATNFTVAGSIPQITSFSPSSGLAQTTQVQGTIVTIDGSGFSTVQNGNIVKFNGVTASIATYTATRLVVVVPTGATTGPITVTANEATAASATNFTVTGGAAGPQIISFTPTSGNAGTTVTLTGVGFNPQVSQNTVHFNDVLAIAFEATATSIKAVVPAGATTGPIRITANGLSNLSETIFTILTPAGPAPQIASFSPTNGFVSSTVTINGSGFGTSVTTNEVKFHGGAIATVLTAESYVLTVRVPNDALTGPIRVTTGGGTVTTSSDFFVCQTGTVQVTPSATICAGASKTLTASGANSYTWSPGAGLSAVTGGQVIATPAQTTTYTVVGTASGGCVASATVTVTVNTGCAPFTISLRTIAAAQGENVAPVGLDITGDQKPVSVVLYHRKIKETAWQMETAVSTSSSEYNVTVQPTWVDEFGMEYYFTATDQALRLLTSAKGFAYLTRAAGNAVVALAIGNSAHDYRIISFPMQFQSYDIATVLAPAIEKFGGFDDAKWRVVHYKQGANIDHTNGLSKIDHGKGYWFLSVEPVSLNLSGPPLQVNQNAPFQMSLDAGWTQIGNPFDFNISWSDVLAKNGVLSGVGQLYVFGPTGFGVSNNLKARSGGFVNSGLARTLSIPVTVAVGSGSRVASPFDLPFSELDAGEWFVPLTVQHGNIIHDMGGFGMSPDASSSKDRFDEATLPRFIKYVELNSEHPEYFQRHFMRDVVPTADSHNWSFNVESNGDEPTALIEWDYAALARNEAALLLHDEASKMIIDMKRQGSYRFELKGKRTLTILFGRDDQHVLRESTELGVPFPNPMNENASVPFIAARDSRHVQIDIYDMMGRRVRTLAAGEYVPGYHEIGWDAADNSGVKVSSGVYIIRLVDGSFKSREMRIVVK